MRKISQSIAFMALLLQISNAQSSEKTLVSTINPKHQTSMVFAPAGNVEIRKSTSEFVQVQTTISIENSSDGVLKSLIQAGRYALHGEVQKADFVIDSPGLKKQVSIGGIVLLEKISYIVFVPENVSIVIENNRLEAAELGIE